MTSRLAAAGLVRVSLRLGRMAKRPGTSGADGREAWEMAEHGDLAMAAGSIGRSAGRGEGSSRRAEACTVLKRKQGSGRPDAYEVAMWEGGLVSDFQPRSLETSAQFGFCRPYFVYG